MFWFVTNVGLHLNVHPMAGSAAASFTQIRELDVHLVLSWPSYLCI